MTPLETLRSRKPALLKIARKYGVRNIRVFGSVAQGGAKRGSDIDLLVGMERGRSLIDLGGFQYYASELLGARVDPVLETSVHPKLRKRIFGEAQPL